MKREDINKTSTGVTLPNIHHTISGVLFPASRNDVIEYARNKGADSGILDKLEELPNKQYSNETDVLEHLNIAVR